MLLRVFVNVEKITSQLSLLTLPEGARRHGRRYYPRFSLLSGVQMHFAFMDQFGSNDCITDFTRISFLQVFIDGGCEKFHPADTQMMPMAVVQKGREEMLTMTFFAFIFIHIHIHFYTLHLFLYLETERTKFLLPPDLNMHELGTHCPDLIRYSEL